MHSVGVVGSSLGWTYISADYERAHNKSNEIFWIPLLEPRLLFGYYYLKYKSFHGEIWANFRQVEQGFS